MMTKNYLHAVDNTALFVTDTRFYGAGQDYFYAKNYDKINFIRLKDLVLEGTKLFLSTIELFCRAQQCALKKN